MATTPKSGSRAAPKPASRKASSTNGKSRASSAKPTPRASTPAPEPARSTASKLRAPAMAGGAAIAGILGGIALGAKALPRKRRGLQLPSISGLDLDKLDINKTRKQLARASKGFGDFTRELRKAGEQAERVGKALD
jgi:hypothetical protein